MKLFFFTVDQLYTVKGRRLAKDILTSMKNMAIIFFTNIGIIGYWVIFLLKAFVLRFFYIIVDIGLPPVLFLSFY